MKYWLLRLFSKYMIEDEQPTLNITLGNQQFVVSEYWWEDNDFVFMTDDGQKYCLSNAYPIDMQIHGLDCTSEEAVICVTSQDSI